MATFTSVQQYRQHNNRRIKKLKASSMKTALEAATFMVARTKQLAPVHSGETRRNVRKRRNKNGYLISNYVQGSFKQNLWANRTAPYRSVRMYWNGGRPTVYGDGSHRITGTPRFFHFATLHTRKKLQQLAKRNIRKVLA